MSELGPESSEQALGETTGNRGGRRRIIVIPVVSLLVVAALIWSFLQGSSDTPQAAALDTQSAQPTNVVVSTPTASPSAAEAKPSEAPGTSEAVPPGPTPAPAPAPAATPAPGPVEEAPAPSIGKDADLATVEQPVSKPVPLEDSSTIVAGLSATVKDLTAVDGTAQGIGEIAGPAIRFSVVIENKTAKELSTASTVVTVDYGGAQIPAAPLSGPDVADFPAAVGPGKSVTGTFVFNVPNDQRGQVRILVNYQASVPVAAFEGAAPSNKGKP